MPLDRELFGSKLKWYREQHEQTFEELASATGIAQEKLQQYEAGQAEPTGDDILILADFFHADYNYFISNERDAALKRIETLYRNHDGDLRKQDKWSILEFHFLCQCEQFLLTELRRVVPEEQRFYYAKLGKRPRQEAEEAVAEVRKHLRYQSRDFPEDVFRVLRQLGFHVFRRRLNNSSISGLFLNDPVTGKCILINYDEDIYRQRFSAAHEAGHAILDYDQDFILSVKGQRSDPEIRANYFAARFLIPFDYLRQIPERSMWDSEKLQKYAVALSVNPESLAYALSDARLITSGQKDELKSIRLPKNQKTDVEIPSDIPERSKAIKTTLLERGLSNYYVGLNFDAYDNGIISAGRLAENLLTDEAGLIDIAAIYGRSLAHGD